MPNLRGTGAWEVAATNVTSGTISTGSVAEFLVQATAPAASDKGTRIKYHTRGGPTAFTGNGTDTLYYRAPVDALVSVALDVGATPTVVPTLLAWPEDFDVHVKMPQSHYVDGEGFTVQVKQNNLLEITPVFAAVDDGGAVPKTFTAGTNGLHSAVFTEAELTGDLSVTATLTDIFGNVEIDAGSIKYSAPATSGAPLYTTDPGVEAVLADGWTVDFNALSIPAEFDPVGTPQYVSVLRSGFNSLGQAATVEDGVYLRKRVRQPYPNQASLTPDTVALGDYIYAGDTVNGVTQGSTRVAPRPICLWLTPDYRIAQDTGVFDVELAVVHAHGRNGSPVAAVKFIVSDGVNPNVEMLVSSQSSKQYAASGLYVPYYGASIDVSSLNDGELTVDAIVYPHVGNSYQISVHGQPFPSPDCTVLKYWKNTGTAYGRSKVLISTTGNDGTGTATDLAGTPSPFLTYGAAMLAAEARNLAQYGREDIGGTLIQFEPGTHTLSAVSPFTANWGAMPIIHEAVNPANKATTIITNPASSMRNGLQHYSVFRNLTIDKSSDNFFIDNKATAVDLDHHVEFTNVSITMSAGLATFSSFFYEAGRIHCTDMDISAAFFDALGQDNVLKMWTLVGCDVPYIDGSTRHVIGSRVRNSGYTMEDGGAGLGSRPAPKGVLFLNSYITRTNDSDAVIRVSDPIDVNGLAIVGCVVEKQAATATSPALRVGADADLSAMENVVVQHSTCMGARTNFLYNDAGNAVKSGYVQGSVFNEFNTKSDVFGTNGTFIGNWPAIYHVGYAGNTYITGSQSTDLFEVGSWLGEVAEDGAVSGSDGSPVVMNFVNDQSGPGTGDSDFTPGVGSAVSTVRARSTSLLVDMNGRVLPVDGTAKAGALQAA